MGERIGFNCYMFRLCGKNSIKNGRRREGEEWNLKKVTDCCIYECQWVPFKTDRLDSKRFFKKKEN